MAINHTLRVTIHSQNVATFDQTHKNLNKMELIIGNYYENIKCENFKDIETGRIRVRALSGQNLPTNVVIECSKSERELHPIGTKFITENIKFCQKTDGRIYFRAKDQFIKKIV